MTQLNSKIFIRGEIILLTGLHIGGTNSAMGIGGPDSTVVRNPIDDKPYIPGSSLKGKMRALVEWSDGTIGNGHMRDIRNVSSDDPSTNSAKLFGTARTDQKQRPSKIIVRDCKLLTPIDEFGNTDLPYTESKTEVVIDRITAKANPRQIERVPAGARFELNLVINVFDEDDENNLLTTAFRALTYLKDDYLGGSGSRGYGQVDFENLNVSKRNMNDYDNPISLTDKWNSFEI